MRLLNLHIHSAPGRGGPPTLSDNPQKINGLAGITLGAIVQSITMLTISTILGLISIWQVGLIGIACTPILISASYIHLHCCAQGPAQQEGI